VLSLIPPPLIKPLTDLTVAAYFLVTVLAVSTPAHGGDIPEVEANQPVDIDDPDVDLSAVFGDPAGNIAAEHLAGGAYSRKEETAKRCRNSYGSALDAGFSCIRSANAARRKKRDECEMLSNERHASFSFFGFFEFDTTSMPQEECKAQTQEAHEEAIELCVQRMMSEADRMDFAGCQNSFSNRLRERARSFKE